MSSEEPQRLQRYLARCGVASRRACEQLIVDGRVTVNGRVSDELGAKVMPGVDAVAVDGRPVVPPAQFATLVMNKPKGVLTTMDDPQGRPTVASLVPTDRFPGLYPVGRLDGDTTGLLLFTNDGKLGNGLIHPRRHVTKQYLALVEGAPDEAQLRSLREGVLLDDGPTLPASVRVLPPREARAQAAQLDWHLKGGNRIVELAISEGRNRQVRRMLAHIGHPVVQLHRSQLGPLRLGGLEPGCWRLLTEAEVDDLRRQAEGC